MDGNQRKYHGQIEINDLVALAVSNAAARRNQVLDTEETLPALSDEQAGSIAGGSVVEEIIYFGGYLLGKIS